MNRSEFINNAQETLGESIRKLERRPLFIVVEDNKDDATAISLELDRYFSKCSVLVYDTAEEALVVLRSVKADAVFLDIRLPRMDGVEAMLLMRKQFQETSIVIVTGLPEDSSKTLAAISAGAVKVINKPVSQTDIHQLFGT